MDNKIVDGNGAESVVRRQLESIYGEKLKDIFFRKAWHTPIGTSGAGIWEVEGTFRFKKGLFSTKKRVFRYQIDSENGKIIGHEEITPK